METQTFFISHCNSDSNIAEIISTFLKGISLGVMGTWFSSDSSSFGGIQPKDIWIDRIHDQIKKSTGLISIITPNSINKPWIYYESGVAHSIDSCGVIPVCVGIKREDIGMPLSVYQCYQLTDPRSLQALSKKILGSCGLDFNESLFQKYSEHMMKELTKIKFSDKEDFNDKIDISRFVSEIKEHIDNRLSEKIQVVNSPIIDIDTEKEDSFFSYTVVFNCLLPYHKSTFYLEVKTNDSVQYILDSIYNSLYPTLEAYTYLEKWIIEEGQNHQKLVIEYITSSMIPAIDIFKRGSQWNIIELKKEYVISENNYFRNFIKSKKRSFTEK